MKKLSFYFIIISTLIFGSCASKSEFGINVMAEGQKTMVADSMKFAALDYVDDHWETWGDISNDSIFWVRSSTSFTEYYPGSMVGLRIIGTGAWEMYWDGVYLGNNGSLAINNDIEIPGKYVTNVLLPDSLAQIGDHVLALRCTQSNSSLTQHLFYGAYDYNELLTEPLQMSKYMFFIAGIFFMASLYFLIIYLGDRKDYSLLLLSVIGLVFLLLLLLEYCKLYYSYEYPFQRFRIVTIGYLHVALSALIPFFFALEFNISWKKYLAIFLLGGILLIELSNPGHYDDAAQLQNRFMWFTSLGIVLWACYKKYKDAFIVLIGFVGSFLVFHFIPYFKINFVSDDDVSVFVSFICIILTMLYIMGSRRKEQRIAYQESLVTSERLKNELLKKNIKPHFIMNTLTSLIDWVEESPKEGVKFIHALADEFDILNDIADHKLVPIEQEIKLCENHLKVMSFRKEIKYRWIQDGIDSNEIIPPAILHTLVENGVTHSRPNASGEILFILNYSKGKGYKQYKLLVKSEIDTNVKSNVDANKVIGTGTKYIKSRLSESYGDNWKYESKAVPEGWLTTIRIMNQN